MFAPGHLGELTPWLPFELVDDVLEQTKTVQRRLRALPSRAGVYFVLALGLFPGLGYRRVWGKLAAGLAGLDVCCPSEKALRDVRRRLGPAPLKALFEVVAVPLAWPYMRGVSFCGLRTVAFDGLNSLKVPDTGRNRAWLGKARSRVGVTGYPALRVLALAETGTRGLLGAVLGADRDEAGLARHLLGRLGPGMLVLADRAYDAADFLAAVAATGAQFLIRGTACRSPQVLQVLPDGSYLAQIGGLPVRIIEASVQIAGADGSTVADSYRLITTLTDHRRCPADALARLYHERWEIESAYYALRHTLLDGRVLRSGDRPGLEQETWALLTVYQLLRMAMAAAVATQPGTDPDRASFTTAQQATRDTLITATGICPDDPTHPTTPRRALLGPLLPASRPRYSSRKVKSPRSRYPGRDDDPRPALPTTITALRITIHTPQLGPHPRPSPRARQKPRPGSYRHRVLALMNTTPGQPWATTDLATHLHIPRSQLQSHLDRWTKTGFLTRTAPATYTPAQPP